MIKRNIISRIVRVLTAKILIAVRVKPPYDSHDMARFHNRLRCVIITGGKSNVPVLPLMFMRFKK